MELKKSGMALCLILFCLSGFSQKYFDMPFSVNMGEVTFPDSVQVRLSLYQKTSQTCKVKNVVITSNDVKHIQFSNAVNGGDSLVVSWYFKPNQNVQYQGTIFIMTDDSAYIYSCQLTGKGKFKESIYDTTFNLYDEALKGALNKISSNGYVSLGYNQARDKMFMEIDNEKVNGGGASQNTSRCVYTGRVITGYTNRQDAQNNYNFNTEHTWPQSLFSSAEPMLSDLYHLFPTDESANTQRGNNPFSMVNNASWTGGNSKSNGSSFEPGNEHKGKVARAMMYFVIRYQNYAGFFTAQENVLRQWNQSFLPDEVELKRQVDISKLQKNRNPFIDYPQFAERLFKIGTTGNRPFDYSFVAPADTLYLGSFMAGDTLSFQFPVSHSGNYLVPVSPGPLGKGHFKDIGNALTQQGIPAYIRMAGRIQGDTGMYRDTFSLVSNTPAPQRKLMVIEAKIIPAQIPSAVSTIQKWPWDASLSAHELNLNSEVTANWLLLSLEGKLLYQGTGQKIKIRMDIPPGFYLLQYQAGSFSEVKKMALVY